MGLGAVATRQHASGCKEYSTIDSLGMCNYYNTLAENSYAPVFCTYVYSGDGEYVQVAVMLP